MSLKQLIYSEDALQRMPSIVKLLQTNKVDTQITLWVNKNYYHLEYIRKTVNKISSFILISGPAVFVSVKTLNSKVGQKHVNI